MLGAMKKVLAFTLALAACSPPPPRTPSQPSPLLDQRIPDFETETLSGKRVTTESFDGHPVVLAFVSTDCGAPCEKTLAAVKEAFDYEERTVAWVIFAGEEDPKQVRSYAARLGLEFPVVIDGGMRLEKRFLVSSQPTVIVLDTAHTVRWIGNEVTGPELSRIVAEQIKNPLTQ
jgi:peroxiredoxin